MIFGAHVTLYSTDAVADRAFLAEVLGLPAVDAGQGWLIFALPPAEVAIHPTDGAPTQTLYFTCDDLKAEMAGLAANGVRGSPVETARWGSLTRIKLPGGGEVGVYQPTHPLALTRAPKG